MAKLDGITDIKMQLIHCSLVGALWNGYVMMVENNEIAKKVYEISDNKVVIIN